MDFWQEIGKMETFIKIFDIEEGAYNKEYEIWGLGDFHLGARACNEELIEQVVKRIASNPDAYWIGTGDYCDCIVMSDQKRFDPKGIAPWITLENLWESPFLQTNKAIELLEPIKDQCIGLLEGNHEYELWKRHNQNITAVIAREFRVPYLGYSAWGYLKWRMKGGRPSRALSLYAHHGYGGGRTTGGKANKLVHAGMRFHADITILGHGHDPFLHPVDKPRLIDRGNGKPKFRTDTRIEIASSSFLKTMEEGTTTYSEKMGYDTVWMGATYGTIIPFANNPEGGYRYKLGVHAADV